MPLPVAETTRAAQIGSFAPQEPISVPILIIPSGELVAGVPIPATVRLPATGTKLIVKLWLKDCQTRTVVDGPRWLLDFNPSLEGEYTEAVTQITLPLGSIEVSFEAIAIDMQTQRESHKARVVRSATPPNLAQGGDVDFEIAL
jgi:hypothetical protein